MPSRSGLEAMPATCPVTWSPKDQDGHVPATTQAMQPALTDVRPLAKET